jgi:hypothetical protein
MTAIYIFKLEFLIHRSDTNGDVASSSKIHHIIDSAAFLHIRICILLKVLFFLYFHGGIFLGMLKYFYEDFFLVAIKNLPVFKKIFLVPLMTKWFLQG